MTTNLRRKEPLVNSMKGLLLITLIFLSCCHERQCEVNLVVDTNLQFVSNASLKNYQDSQQLDSTVVDILKNSELAIMYFERSQGDHGWYKILSVNGKRAEQLWVNHGSTAYYNGDRVRFMEDGVKKKELTVIEVLDLIDRLQKLGAFSLKEENKLINKCGSAESWDHPPIASLIIVREGKVREVHYSDVSRQIENCEDVSDWIRMKKIGSLFLDSWKGFENNG